MTVFIITENYDIVGEGIGNQICDVYDNKEDAINRFHELIQFCKYDYNKQVQCGEISKGEDYWSCTADDFYYCFLVEEKEVLTGSHSI